MRNSIREDLEGIDDPIGSSYEDLKEVIDCLLSSNGLEEKELISEETIRVVS